MRREPGWNDTLLVAKPADPPDSGIRNPHSSQRCLLVPSKPASTVLERTRRTCPRVGHTPTRGFVSMKTCVSLEQPSSSPE
jgi:hypothetical protein